MSKFLCTLLSMSLGGSLMALLLLLLRPLLHRRGRHTALFYLYLPVLLRLLLPLPGFLPFSLLQRTELTEQVNVRENTAMARPIHVVDGLESATGTIQAQPTSNLQPISEDPELPVAAASTVPTAAKSPAPRRLTVDAVTVAAAVYFTGAALTLLYYLLGYARFVRAVRRSGERAPESAYAALAQLCPEGTVGLLCSPAAPVPLLMGLRRALIVLPPDAVGEDELTDVLRHELTHCRRQDLCYKWLMMLTLCVHWFNPLLYILRRTMATDCELSCDEDIIRDMNPRERQHYGETLIRLSAHPHLPPSLPAATLSEGKEQLRTRLLSIMHTAPNPSTAVLTWLLCAVVLCGCGSVVGSGARGGTESPAPAATPQLLRNEDGSWSTDGNVWYSAGQFVMNRQGLWTTDGNIWHGDRFWTTDGNTRYDNSVFLGERTPLYATDGNVSLAHSKPVTVSSVDELLHVIGRENYILLSPGVYDLSQASVDFYPSVHWKPRDGEQVMYSTGIYGLVLQSATGRSEDVTLLLGGSEHTAFNFSSCYNLNLQHLTFSSAAGEENPGSLLGFEECHSVYLGDCAFTSNGGSALQLLDSRYVTLEDCAFQGIRQDNVRLENSQAVLCKNCEFTGAASALPVADTSGNFFDGCTLDGQVLAGDGATPLYS